MKIVHYLQLILTAALAAEKTLEGTFPQMALIEGLTLGLLSMLGVFSVQASISGVNK